MTKENERSRDSRSNPPRSVSAAAAEHLAAKLTAAQDHARLALVEFLDSYDPEDQPNFRHAVGQTINLIGAVDELAATIGVSPATMHRWASGASVPITAARAIVAVILKNALTEGVPSKSTRQAALHTASEEAFRSLRRRRT